MANYSTILNNKLTAIGASTIAESYDSAGALPTLLLTDIGEIAYTSNNGKLNAWNGTSWSTVGIVNTSPSVSSTNNADLATDGTPTVITFYDSDAEDVPLTWSYSVTSGSLGGTTVSVSGSTFTITPSTNTSDAGSFTLSFIATDGINQASTTASYSLAFITFGGTNYGYTSGGQASGPSQPNLNVIDKFAFAVDTNATDVGDLVTTMNRPAGHSSQDYGWTSGGYGEPGDIDYYKKFIQRWPFASGGNSVQLGNLTLERYLLVGHSDKVNGFGYSAGGFTGYPPAIRSIIDRFPFSTGSNASSVGNLTQAVYEHAANNSLEYGYTSGGATAPGREPIIGSVEKYAFVSGSVSSGVIGNNYGRFGATGLSSDTYGYLAGGGGGPSTPNPVAIAITTIAKFPFAASVSISSPGTLSGGILNAAGSSSTTYGYICGGWPISGPNGRSKTNAVSKYSFANDVSSASVVLSLTVARANAASSHY